MGPNIRFPVDMLKRNRDETTSGDFDIMYHHPNMTPVHLCILKPRNKKHAIKCHDDHVETFFDWKGGQRDASPTLQQARKELTAGNKALTTVESDHNANSHPMSRGTDSCININIHQ
jgi:hypothetical protein